MRARTFLFLGVAGTAFGCGITFSPGDYGGGATVETTPDAAPNDAGPIVDAVAPIDVVVPADTGPPPAGHVLLFAGTKTGGTETNDVWQFPVAASGDLGPVEYLQPAPLSKRPQAVAISGGKILSAVQGSSSRIVQIADFANGITSPWTTAVVENAALDGYGSFFAHGSLVVVGGSTTENGTDGDGNPTSTTTNHPDLYVSMLSGTSYPAPNNVKSSVALPDALVDVLAFTTGELAFVWGNPDRATLYGGKVDEKNGFAAVSKTAITNPQDGKPHTPTSAIACAGAGRVFFGGGDKDTLVLTASLDEAGTIGAWKTGTALPTTLTHAGCVVLAGAVYLFGGTAPLPGETNKTDATAKVLRARFAADGTMQAWETLPQVLPGARSNVFALTY